mmetsp:Transcript_29199/g.62090  ORF Transcript_29199/g.62090 Transcript_29199/m.62090 type:complete len:400 (-) Transcript_29199:165-1364(-)
MNAFYESLSTKVWLNLRQKTAILFSPTCPQSRRTVCTLFSPSLILIFHRPTTPLSITIHVSPHDNPQPLLFLHHLLSRPHVPNSPRPCNPLLQPSRMPLIGLFGIFRQSIESTKLRNLLPIVENEQCRQRLDVQFRHEEGRFGNVDTKELGLQMLLGNDFQMIIHDLTAFEIIVVEMDNDVFGGAGAFGEEFILCDGTERAVTQRDVCGTLGLLLFQLCHASLTHCMQYVILIIEQVTVFIIVVFRFGFVVIVVIVRIFLLQIIKFHSSHLFLDVHNLLILLVSFPRVRLLSCQCRGLGLLSLVLMQFFVRCAGWGAIDVVFFVGALSVFFLEFVHGLSETLLDIVGYFFVDFLLVISEVCEWVCQGVERVGLYELSGLGVADGVLIGGILQWHGDCAV